MTAQAMMKQVGVGVVVGVLVMVMVAWMQRKNILFPPVADNRQKEQGSVLGFNLGW